MEDTAYAVSENQNKVQWENGTKEMKRYCVLDHASQALLEKAFETFHMTGRTCHRILKVSRTIADMAGEEAIKKEHVQEALLYRRTSFR